MRKTEFTELVIRKLKPITESGSYCYYYNCYFNYNNYFNCTNKFVCYRESGIQSFHPLMYRKINIFYSRTSDDRRETKLFAADTGDTVKK